MAWYSRPLRAVGKLPPANAAPVQVRHDLQVPGADGVVLYADLYQPERATHPNAPLLLVRSPYGRRGKWGVVYGQLFAERGYTVLIQSTRGTYGSTGTFEPMVHEAEDGAATVAWLREQPWFPGGFIVMGASYLAFTGWAIASAPPPELRGLACHVGLHQWRDAIYPDGLLALDFALTWTANRLRPDDPDSFLLNLVKKRPDVRTELSAAFEDLPLAAAAEQALGGRAPWFSQWLDHGPDDRDYWAAYDASTALERVDVPVLLLGGWQDMFLDQVLHQHARLRARGVPTTLVVGPWTHRGLEKDWPAMVTRTLTWLEALSTDPDQLNPDPEVHLGGTTQWMRTPWPPTRVSRQRWTLQPGAGLTTGDARPGTPDTYTYDPTDPTPTVGGATTREDAGVQDNRRHEQRPDVLTYTSPPLDRDLDVLGVPTARVRLRCDTETFDCFVRLCAVEANGASVNVCDGITRTTGHQPGALATIEVTLAPTAYRFASGQSLRLQVAGGSHPRFARNLGVDHSRSAQTSTAPTTVELHHDPAQPSTLTVPAGDAEVPEPAAAAAA